MRYILIILVFLSVGAKAQMVIKAHANYRPYASPAANLLLDDYPNAAAAYSLRKLDKDYAGNCIRVRRSNDNAESDIGFTSGGDLDTASLKTFVGSNSGFVTTWYDQSGNARNTTQSTAANQPRIVDLGIIDRRSGDISLVFDGSNDNLQNATTGFSVNNVTHYAVSSRGNSTNAFRTIYSTGILMDANGFGFFYSNASLAQDALYQQVRTGNLSASVGAYTNTLNTNNLIFGLSPNTTNDTVYYNGGDIKVISLSRSSQSTNAHIIIGATFTGAPNTTPRFFLNGSVTEIVFWSANRNADRTGILTNVNNYWSIY